MRTIKFRGKRLDNGGWECGGIIPVNVGLKVIAEEKWFIIGKHTGGMSKNYEHNILLTEVDPKTVGQFTGLYDKNGKEIYEGDIIRVGHDKDKYKCRDTISFIGNIKWNEVSMYWDVGGQILTTLSTVDAFYNIEIIGNIHDNPELLKTK